MTTINNYIKWASNTAELKAALAQGTNQIVAMKDAVDRTARSLGGEGLMRAAHNTTAAVQQLGGATKLTAAEKERINATLTKTIEKYELLGQTAPPAMVELEQATRKAQSATELFQERWAAFAAASGAAVIGIRQAAVALQDLLMASSSQEDALVRVNTALQAQGTLTPLVAQQYEALASQFQQTTIFGDELISEMQALLIQIGDVMPAQMESALVAATNLAAGLRIDLRTATELVGKAFAGETGTLKRYGIVIDEATLKAGGAAAVLEAINDKMGGQAQAQAATYSGQMKQLANQYGDVKERAGQLLAQAILPLLEAFTSLSPQTQTVISAAVILGGVLGPVALGFTGIVSAVTLLLPVLSVALPAAFAAVMPFLGPAGLIAAGAAAVVVAWKNWDQIAGIAQGVYQGVKTWLVDAFAAVVESVRQKIEAVTGFFKGMYDKVVGGSYVPDMMIRIEQEFGKLHTIMVAPAVLASQQVSAAFGSMASTVSLSSQGVTQSVSTTFMEQVSGVFASFVSGPLSGLSWQIGDTFGPKVQGAISGFQNILKSGFQAATGIARVFVGDFTGLIDAAVGAWNFFKGISNAFRGGEEGVHVNPARDRFLSQFGGGGTGEGSGFMNLAALLTSHGAGHGGGSLHAALRAADTMGEFQQSIQAISDFLQPKGVDVKVGGFATGTHGQFLNFGSGTPAILHGREAVVTEAEGRMGGRQMSKLMERLDAMMGEMASQRRALRADLFLAMRDGGAHARAR